MKKKVVILGGGVAGMSAAHELIERGFDVALYEYKTIPGGKARSMPVPGSGTDGRFDLPGEHGFRFFPGFYRHITDTMKRIPYGPNENGVFDNLVPVPRMGMARFDYPLTVSLADTDAPLCKIFEIYEHDWPTLWHKQDKKRFEQGLPWDGKILDTKRFSIHALAEMLF